MLQGLVGMAAANCMWNWIKPSERAKYFANQKPAAAGVTNVYFPPGILSARWNDVVRSRSACVSTGPMAPLVLAAITMFGRTTVSFAYRRTSFRPEVARSIIDHFCRRAASL